MVNVKSALFWLTVWGVAFAYIEASVVVYLRAIYYPEGFVFPVVIAENRMIVTELFRELATLVIMWATVKLAYERLQSQFAAFMVLFGIWDIFYYLFLKMVLGWPQSLASWDILFLIPMPWAGPVWAPVVVSLGLISAGVVMLQRHAKGMFFEFSRSFVLVEALSAAVIITSFLIPGYAVVLQRVPESFPVYLFWGGFILGLGSFVYQVNRSAYLR